MDLCGRGKMERVCVMYYGGFDLLANHHSPPIGDWHPQGRRHSLRPTGEVFEGVIAT